MLASSVVRIVVRMVGSLVVLGGWADDGGWVGTTSRLARLESVVWFVLGLSLDLHCWGSDEKQSINQPVRRRRSLHGGSVYKQASRGSNQHEFDETEFARTTWCVCLLTRAF